MEIKELKLLFSEIAKSKGFGYAFGGWFKESEECIVVINLQKSNFGNYFEVNIKIFIQGLFAGIYRIDKNLVVRLTGDIFLRVPKTYRYLLDLDSEMHLSERSELMSRMFDLFISPIAENSLTKSGILEMGKNGKINILPAVERRLIGDQKC